MSEQAGIIICSSIHTSLPLTPPRSTHIICLSPLLSSLAARSPDTGLFIFLTAVSSLFFAFAFLIPLLMVAGPEGRQGDLLALMPAMLGVESSDLNIKKALANGACVIDARSTNAYAKAHAGGAINAPAGGPMGGKAAISIARIEEALPKDRNSPIVCYCDGGVEAKPVAKALMAKGYTNVINAGSLARVRRLIRVRSRVKQIV